MSTTPPTVTTLVGRLVADPELRFTPSGVAVTNFTVASNERVYNSTTRQYEDGPATFMPVNVWRGYAENVAESLHKGDVVLVVGRLKQRHWETRDGDKRSRIELEADEIGPGLRWVTATLRRANPSASPQKASDPDPWTSGSSSSSFGGGGNDDQPPF